MQYKHKEDLIKLIEKNIGYNFIDKNLLIQSVTHRSVSHKHNERLEFLGDSILNFVIAEYLYTKFTHENEGILTRIRASLINEATLAIIAKQLQVKDFLILGPGELKSGGFNRDSILADTVEALIGAIYLDSNIDNIKRILVTWYQPLLIDINPTVSLKDAKTRLQEYLQSKKKSLPSYNVIAITGEDHQQTFTVTCTIDGLAETFIGTGNSKRRAEQDVANKVLEKLGCNK